MEGERPDYLLSVEKEEKKKCTSVKIVMCAVALSVGSFVLLLWLPALPWACGGFSMAYHNTFPSAGHPANAPLSERVLVGTVCLMAILYPMTFFPALAATLLRLSDKVVKYGSPILFASVPVFYVLVLVLLVMWFWYRF